MIQAPIQHFTSTLAPPIDALQYSQTGQDSSPLTSKGPSFQPTLGSLHVIYLKLPPHNEGFCIPQSPINVPECPEAAM